MLGVSLWKVLYGFLVQSIKSLEALLEEIYQGDLEMPLLRRSRTLEMKLRNESEPQGTDRIQKHETKRVRQSYCSEVLVKFASYTIEWSKKVLFIQEDLLVFAWSQHKALLKEDEFTRIVKQDTTCEIDVEVRWLLSRIIFDLAWDFKTPNLRFALFALVCNLGS